MRQKLLLALETIRNLEPVTLSNISELDETFVLDSYKGSSVPEEAERGPRKHGARAPQNSYNSYMQRLKNLVKY